MREKENCAFFIYPTLTKLYHIKLRLMRKGSFKGRLKKIKNPQSILREKRNPVRKQVSAGQKEIPSSSVIHYFQVNILVGCFFLPFNLTENM